MKKIYLVLTVLSLSGLNAFADNCHNSHLETRSSSEITTCTNSIITSFSTEEKNYLNDKLEFIQFLTESIPFIENFSMDLNSLIKQLNKINFVLNIPSKELKETKNKIYELKAYNKDDVITILVLSSIEKKVDELEKNYAGFTNNTFLSAKNEIVKSILGTIKALDINDLKISINSYKQEVINILKEAERIPEFSRTELSEYRSKLALL